MADERIWLMLDEGGSIIKAQDECYEELGRMDTDGNVMTAHPGLEGELERVTKAALRFGSLGSLESGAWLEAFIKVEA